MKPNSGIKKRKYTKAKDSGDIFTQVGRTENGFLLTRDVKTKTYKNGKTAQFVYYVNKTDGVCVSKKEIIKAFVEKFSKMTESIIIQCLYYYFIFKTE